MSIMYTINNHQKIEISNPYVIVANYSNFDLNELGEMFFSIQLILYLTI